MRAGCDSGYCGHRDRFLRIWCAAGYRCDYSGRPVAEKEGQEAGAGKGFAITGIVTGAVAVLFSLCMLFMYISVASDC